MELVTGYKGMNHVTAEQLADLQAGMLGYQSCVLNIGEKLKADIITSNKIRIFDGVMVFFGRQAIVEAGDYEDVTIENGTLGLYRNDIIAVEYRKDESSGIENTSLKVLKGATASKAVDPTVTTNDIRKGAFESEIPLYRVKLNGLAIEKVEPLYTLGNNIGSLTKDIDTLNNNLTALNSKITVYGGLAVKGSKFSHNLVYRVKNGICFVTGETTPSSDVIHGDIVCTGLPSPLVIPYVTLPTATGNYSAMLGVNGTLSMYYPVYTAVARVDFSFCYPVN